jgi:hypothetical protein
MIPMRSGHPGHYVNKKEKTNQAANTLRLDALGSAKLILYSDSQ